ncbi:ubiquitin-specific protease ubp1 [Coemansia sp. RSA 2424]|nr:ubiquitin-specific protease ubp1 [Coemansia sp. RSA 2424]
MSLSAFQGSSRSLVLVATVSVASLLALAMMAASLTGTSARQGKRPAGKSKGRSKYKQKIFMRGLYNLGNTCFMNSTLQSLASLEEFNTYADNCVRLLSPSGMSTSYSTDADIAVQLKQVLEQLRPHACRVSAYSPRALVNSLSKKGRWMASRAEQDAQELFQLVSSTLQATMRESDPSLFNSDFLANNAPLENSIISTTSSSGSSRSAGSEQYPSRRRSSTAACRMPPFSNPLLGMAASRIACVKCGYTAAIRHFTFDNLSLTVPRARSTTVEECLSMYTIIDQLDDFKCRYCAVAATLAQTRADIQRRRAELAGLDASSKRATRLSAVLATLIAQQSQLEQALATNPEAELKGVQLVSPQLSASTKQTMIARTPKILVLHLSRSIFLPTGDTVKNTAHVRLQPLLDISPFSTTGHMHTDASRPISGPDAPAGIPNATDSYIQAQRNNCLYRLSAVVFHTGAHNSGHYVAYRRVSPSAGSSHDDGATVESEQPWTEEARWFMLSDAETSEVSLDTVLSAGTGYMLFYERL